MIAQLRLSQPQKKANNMNIKQVYQAVRNWLNPKPQVVENNPSSEKMDAVAKYYKKRYGVVFFVHKFFNVRMPTGDYFGTIPTALTTFFEGVWAFIIGIAAFIFAVAIVIAYPGVLVWAILSKLYRAVFGGILSACAEDVKTISKACNHWEREKPNACGYWSFTATCSNNINLTIPDGVCEGHYSDEAIANAMKIIESNLNREYTIASRSVIIDSENYKLSIEYVIRRNDE